MKLTFIKKFITLFTCFLLLFAFVSHIQTFASFADLMELYYSGGSYEGVQAAKNDYLLDYPEDKTEYECHYLIPKYALNNWANYIRKVRQKKHMNVVTPDNSFLVNDSEQMWTPAIIMEKYDYKKAISYCNPHGTIKQKYLAERYILHLTRKIIHKGDIMDIIMEEVNFIRENFDSKYDRAIDKALRYVKSLEITLLNNKTLFMKNPYCPSRYFEYNLVTQNPYLM